MKQCKPLDSIEDGVFIYEATFNLHMQKLWSLGLKGRNN